MPPDPDDLKRLKWALRALAATASFQMTLFPDAVATADELALDFVRSVAAVRASHEDQLSFEQVHTLGALEEKLAVISRDGVDFDAEIWTDAALHSSPQWEEVRRLAAVALGAFGWSVENLPEALDARGASPVQ
jgi:hypothetical protein